MRASAIVVLFDRMIHAFRTFPSRFVSLADANETLAPNAIML
jgi:hypothetical protein